MHSIIIFSIRNICKHTAFALRIKEYKLTAISRHADIDRPVPSICFRPKSFVSGLDFNSLSGTLLKFHFKQIVTCRLKKMIQKSCTINFHVLHSRYKLRNHFHMGVIYYYIAHRKNIRNASKYKVESVLMKRSRLSKTLV